MPTDDFAEEQPSSGYSERVIKLKSKSNHIICTGSYYFGPHLYDISVGHMFNVQNDDNILITFGCSGNARSELYPVKN